MGRRKLKSTEKGKQVYIYPKEIYVSVLGLDKTVEIAVTAIKAEYDKAQIETNKAIKKVQDLNLDSNCSKQIKNK